jgi:hypothetical protein
LYKQTQFSPPRRSRHPIIPVFHHSKRMAIVRNKLNSQQWTGRGRGPVMRHRLDAPLRATKPNLGELGYLGDRTGRRAQGKCVKQAQFPAGRLGQGLGDEGRLCRTKPIYPRAPGNGRAAGTGRSRRGVTVQNKPNCPKRGTEAVSRRGRWDAAWGRRRVGVVQTNPISGTMPIRRSAFPRGQIVRNKANSSIAERGFRERHRATGVRLRRSCRIADWGTSFRRGCRSCKTNPISPVGGGSGGRNARNEANSGGVGWDGGSGTRPDGPGIRHRMPTPPHGSGHRTIPLPGLPSWSKLPVSSGRRRRRNKYE